jgi:hypothetical protein
MTQLRIALTISGAVSLGAYEGGALAALLLAVQDLDAEEDPPLRIDAIGGASAGSITGVLAGRTLLEGLDPVHVMSESWVKRDSLRALMTRDPHAPLSVEALRSAAVELLDPGDKNRERPKQAFPIEIHMALACLRGLNYRIARLRGSPIEATTYLDWGEFTLRPGQSVGDYTTPEGASVVDFALASGANALGFPARRLNRLTRESDRQMVERGEITNLPSNWSGWLWYTDGGTIENEPLGRTFHLANEIDRDGQGRRLHLLVHPHPTAPPRDHAWADPAAPPFWTKTLARSDKIQRTQTIFEDLRHVEKTNSRILWTEHFRNAITPVIHRDREVWSATLRQVLDAVAVQKVAIDRHEADAIQASEEAMAEATELVEAEPDVDELLSRVLSLVTGLSGKEEARVDVVSPLLLPEASRTPVEELLGGEFLNHFGGFLNERLRWNDFALGYRSMQSWLGNLQDLGVEAHLARRAQDAVSARFDPAWETGWGAKTLRSLPLHDRFRFARLLVHVARVAVGELAVRRVPAGPDAPRAPTN